MPLLFPENIGLFALCKNNNSHHPDVMQHHVGCISPNGALIDFFFGNAAASSSSSCASTIALVAFDNERNKLPALCGQQ